MVAELNVIEISLIEVRLMTVKFVKVQGDLSLRDSCVGFPLLEISFVSLESRSNALSLCLYHDYRLRQK